MYHSFSLRGLHMKRLDLPVNLDILVTTPERIKNLKQTRVLDIFDGAGTSNFHEEGLFSVSTFGRVGSEERETRFSFIDIRIDIFHPYYFKQLCQLKALYKGIMSGKSYAVWDTKIRDFIPSDAITGKTGYHFFMEHWDDINFRPTGSAIRDLRIKFITKFQEKALTRFVLVIPAALRDVQFDEVGNVKEGEINEMYRRLISLSNAVSTNTTGATSVHDVSRFSLQLTFNEIYDYLSSLLEGKGGFLQQKWGSRRVYYGTRNVVTAMNTSPSVMGADNSPKLNHTVVGLFQTMKGTLPLTIHLLQTGWLKSVFNAGEGNAILVNRKTLKPEHVKLDSQTTDKWTTTAGLEKLINSYRETPMRSKHIVLQDYYLGLIYRGPDNTFRIFNNIEDLPEGFDRKFVTPLTYAEFFYSSGYFKWNKIGLYCTRYPVTGTGSVYPSFPYVKNTVKSEMRKELGLDWQPIGPDRVALEFPVMDENPVYIDTMMPHPSRLSGLTMDFDGDTGSGNFVFTDEAVGEVTIRLGKAAAYVNPRGGLLTSPCVETVNRMIVAMTRG